jgi:hypothetical protein
MKLVYLGAGLAAFLINALALSAQTITVSPSACQAITAHTPADDVAYKPGVDVHGNDVASADLNSSGTLNFDADHEFWLPIEIPLEDVLSIAASDTLDAIRESKIGAGTVTVKNGQAYFNGQPLGDANSNAIAAACAKQQAAASR